MSTVNEAENTEAPVAAVAEVVLECPVQKSIKEWGDFLEEKMCAKCHPCMLGSYEAFDMLKRLAEGDGSDSIISHLDRIATDMLIGSRCKKGKDVAKTLKEALNESRDELVEHYEKGLCRHMECAPLTTYLINTDKCTMCGDCLIACKDFAIVGEKRTGYVLGYMPFRVRQKRCVKCDACREVCPVDAVEVFSGRTD